MSAFIEANAAWFFCLGVGTLIVASGLWFVAFKSMGASLRHLEDAKGLLERAQAFHQARSDEPISPRNAEIIIKALEVDPREVAELVANEIKHQEQMRRMGR